MFHPLPNLCNGMLPVLSNSTDGAVSAHAHSFYAHHTSKHTPAPYGGIILHMESHGALYSPHIPRYLISYPTNGSKNIETLIVPDYMICAMFLDPDARVILHCQHSDDLIVSSFADVALSALVQMTSNYGVQLMYDMLSRVIILCIDLTDKPSHIVRMLCLMLIRNLMLRHDFYHKLANFTKLEPLHLCPLIIVVKNVISVFGNLNKYINQCRHNKAKGQDLVPVQHFPEHPITPHDEHGFSQSNVLKSNNKIVQKPLIGGGKLSTKFEGQELATMGISGVSTNSLAGCQIYKFVNYMAQANVEAHSVNQKTFICYCTLDYLAPRLTQAQL